MRLIHAVDGCEIWHGDCLAEGAAEVALHGRRADLLHVDAPYSVKTHEGHRAGKVTADRASGFADPDPVDMSWKRRAERRYATKAQRADIDYCAWGNPEIERFGAEWLPHVDGWATTITDHILAPGWTSTFDDAGLYTFSPLPWVEIGSRVRMVGDGPSGWSCQLVVARPRCAPYSKWGTLPGAYIGPAENKQNRPDRISGGKSLALTCAFLGDYSRRGGLVLDPCLGGGTTMLAARISGRRCIGIEADEGRAELCARLIATKREQLSLLEVIG